MLVIAIATGDLPALNGADGVDCKVNGSPVMMRLVDGFLCFHGDGMDQRCKVLHSEEEADFVRFIAASHGEENERHVIIITAGLDGQPTDLLATGTQVPDDAA